MSETNRFAAAGFFCFLNESWNKILWVFCQSEMFGTVSLTTERTIPSSTDLKGFKIKPLELNSEPDPSGALRSLRRFLVVETQLRTINMRKCGPPKVKHGRTGNQCVHYTAQYETLDTQTLLIVERIISKPGKKLEPTYVLQYVVVQILSTM